MVNQSQRHVVGMMAVNKRAMVRVQKRGTAVVVAPPAARIVTWILKLRGKGVQETAAFTKEYRMSWP